MRLVKPFDKSPRSGGELSIQWIVQLALNPLGDGWELLAGVLQKIRRIAMRFERLLVSILLVDEKMRSVFLLPLHLIHQASGLFARFRRQLAEYFGDFRFAAGCGLPGDGQDDHRKLPITKLACQLSSRAPGFRAQSPA